MAALAAVLLVVEACGVGFVNLALGYAVRHQSMSLAGLKPSAMSAGAWAAGALLVVLLLGCAVVAVVTAVRDRAPGRFGRLALILAAVLNGALGAAAAGIVGWLSFAVVMVILGAVVLTLINYGPGGAAPAVAPEPAPPATP
ncbi:putative integral membrane protein [Streptantibioticus cattleyicolor NRRL 8057 = DSM 46488]|uniref:Putative integral membrane protein n=1 Tax=Streptantibioticus cattleyicolor (strain ATCC 35852 / DSM 46488 / JCM 4925 / NBRC 14057 / NRRL 8057) TaxID=1003195 RepID=G8WR19_STREN|nr:putative integral membrane protein [Streptantibioticus cattleyicolor NRRL 8057 = DSM 46488]